MDEYYEIHYYDYGMTRQTIRIYDRAVAVKKAREMELDMHRGFDRLIHVTVIDLTKEPGHEE